MRGVSSFSTLDIGTGSMRDETDVGLRERRAGLLSSSTNVFHSEQFGHFPTQRGEI
jgi:hypothetical protein